MTGGHGLRVGEVRGGAIGGRQQLICAATRVHQEVMAEILLLNGGARGGGGGGAAGRREERSSGQQRNQASLLIWPPSFGGWQLLAGTVGGPLPLDAPAAAAAAVVR